MLILSNAGPYLLLAASVLASGIGVFVLLRDPHDRTYRSFFVFTIGMSAWSAGVALLYLSNNFLFDKLAFAGGFALFAGLISLAWTFPEKRHFSRKFLLCLVPLAIGFALVPFDLYISGIIVDAKGLVQPVNGPALPFFIALVIGYGAASLVLFGKSFLRSRGIARVQMSYLLGGIFVFFTCLLTFDALLPFFGVYGLNLLGPLSSLLFVASTAYAIVRHQLLDIRIVIQRGLIYTTLLSLIVALYVFLINAFGLVLDRDDGIIFGAGISTTMISIFGVPVIERYFRRVTDKLFFKGRYEYAHAMRSLSEILHISTDFDELIERVQKNLAGIFRAGTVEIMLLSEGVPFPNMRAGFAHEIADRRIMYEPIRLQTEEIGGIIAREKLSGDRYSDEDRQFLQTFSLQAGTALARVRLFEQVREHARELEGRVQERTEELRLSREHEQQMMIEISHNLQTPLAIFQTKLERMKRLSPEDPEILSFERSLSELSLFIEDLMRLSQLEGPNDGAEHEEVCLSALVSQLAEEIDIIANARGVIFHRSIAPEVYVAGDPRRLGEVVMNLAGNALKYMRKSGKRELSISLSSLEDSALICVTDTGIGIRKKDLQHIFERYYRAETGSGSKRGTGLGLAIARQIVERHGGTISAQSISGKGTTMTVTLPRIRKPERGA